MQVRLLLAALALAEARGLVAKAGLLGQVAGVLREEGPGCSLAAGAQCGPALEGVREGLLAGQLPGAPGLLSATAGALLQVGSAKRLRTPLDELGP